MPAWASPRIKMHSRIRLIYGAAQVAILSQNRNMLKNDMKVSKVRK